MCNPRRVTVTATREIAEAWQREVSRTVTLSTQVIGEARVRQPLSNTLGTPVFRALESLLASGNIENWQETETGYRHDVEGGYVFYDMDEQTLEIVATLGETVQAEGRATRQLSGELRETLSTEQEGHYYEDGYGGRTQARAETEAGNAAQHTLDQMAQSRLEDAQREAEEAESSRLHNQAQTEAQTQLTQTAQQRQAQLSGQATQHLDTVGIRCRQAFNTLLAQAYREAILAYARYHGAENISCQEENDHLEIEFFLEK